MSAEFLDAHLPQFRTSERFRLDVLKFVPSAFTTLYTACTVDAPDAVSSAAAADQMARDHASIMENRKL